VPIECKIITGTESELAFQFELVDLRPKLAMLGVYGLSLALMGRTESHPPSRGVPLQAELRTKPFKN
jgi:hypothetical protein